MTSRFPKLQWCVAIVASVATMLIVGAPHWAAAQSGIVGGCGGPVCTTATANISVQNFTVGSANNITGPRTIMVSVRHSDHTSSCAKIKQVVIRAPRDGAVRDIGSVTLPDGGSCNFGPDVVSIPVVSFSDTEIAACTAPIYRKLHVVLRADNLAGTLVDDTGNGSDDYVNVRAVVTCTRDAPNAQTSASVTMHVSSLTVAANPRVYTGACPTTVTFTASYVASVPGPLSTVWTFSDASSATSTTEAKAGYNTVTLNENVNASRNTTVKVTLNANGGQMTSPPVAFRVDCR
ncbi:MAG: hypothetical protein ABI338_00660 [Gemmatimonadaceae bacterium]